MYTSYGGNNFTTANRSLDYHSPNLFLIPLSPLHTTWRYSDLRAVVYMLIKLTHDNSSMCFVYCIATWYAMSRYLVKLTELGTSCGHGNVLSEFNCPFGPTNLRTNGLSDQRAFGLTGLRTNGPSD